jgi:predicted RNA-binding protein (TIGR00451 family)
MRVEKSGFLLRIRKVADYQFGRGAGEILFPEEVTITISRRTKKIRHVYLGNSLLATLKPTDGLFSLSVEGVRRLIYGMKPPRLWVQVQDDVASFIEEGGDVFAKHVVDCDGEIRPAEEVIVVDGRKRVLAVGRSVLSGDEMKAFRRGVAVRVRRGSLKKVKKPTTK